MDTKERILLNALRLFARDGYEAVSVSSIAAELGITKGALYRHYQSKRDIFDHILARMEQRDAERAGEFGVPEGTKDEMEEKYKNTAVAALIGYSKAQFEYWTGDEFAADFRRMLTIERYRNAEMAALYQQYLCAGPAGYVADIFAALGYDAPMERAVRLYAPMYLLYGMYDAAKDKQEVKRLFESCMKERENEYSA